MNITGQAMNGETYAISKQVGNIRKKPTEALQLENVKESYQTADQGTEVKASYFALLCCRCDKHLDDAKQREGERGLFSLQIAVHCQGKPQHELGSEWKEQP